MSKYTDAFDGLCGNCAGFDIHELTEADVRQQAVVSAGDGADPLDEEFIADAIRGLHEWQDARKQPTLAELIEE